MNVKNRVLQQGVKTIFNYLEKNPEKNLNNIMDVFEKLDKDQQFEKYLVYIREIMNDPSNNWYQFIMGLLNDVDKQVLEKLVENFVINETYIGWTKQEELRKKYQCNIPWTILMDPTSACNLHCSGCWAAEYGNRLNLDFETLDRIINEGKELGVYFYIYTGGEPLVRKKDLLKLCRKHHDCIFLTFTNGTLIDEAFAKEMLEVKNLIPAISVEGFEVATDARRGQGTFQHVERAMKILQENRLPFGISCCYTSQNLEVIASEAYYDQMIAWGAKFCWFFHYMPVGKQAVPDLMASASQREKMYHHVRRMRRKKPLFAIDFQNDGEYIGGCIAGGRRYFHINAKGDVEPCVFIHYSNMNIADHSLLECLQSPLFKAYHDHQPFNENHLRPCPMLENPTILPKLVQETKAVNTDYQDQESAGHLCQKCYRYADEWLTTADRLWKESK